MRRAYILSFDPHKTDSLALHKAIKAIPQIINWWHYLGSTYIIISEAPLTEIHHEIMSRWPRQRYFLVKISLNESNGWLPEDAWVWIRKYRAQVD